MLHVAQLYLLLNLLIGPPMNVCVDRDHGLPAWYDPGFQAETQAAFEVMQTAAAEDGVAMTIFSGYRSYAYQVEVYTREEVLYPQTAFSHSAPPGHSEHQLGTALDVAWPGVGLGVIDSRNDLLYAWLEENAHLFGFVLSYPYREVATWPFHNRWFPLVTEYVYEPWHLRYLGVRADELFQAGYLDPTSDILPQDDCQVWP